MVVSDVTGTAEEAELLAAAATLGWARLCLRFEAVVVVVVDADVDVAV